MTEAELLRIAALAISNAITSFSVFLTISTAYLVAAYKVGKQLTRSQVVIVNVLFTLCSFFFAVLAGQAVGRALAFASAAGNANAVQPGYGGFGLAAFWMVVMCLLIYLACLKFMWDIRYSRAE